MSVSAQTASVKVTLARYALLTVGIAALSTAGVLYKLASGSTSTIVAYRMLIAVFMMGPLVFISRTSADPLRHRTIAGSDGRLASLAGVLFAMDVTLWALSVQFTTVSSAALLVSMDPVFVAIAAALLFGERPSLAMIAGMAIAVGGAAVITVGDFHISGRAFVGDALALSAAVAETGYLLLGRHVRQRVDALRYAWIVYGACAACVWLALVALCAPATLGPNDLLICVGLALLPTVLGHTLVSWSLGHMPAAVVAISFLSQPILTAFFAFIVLHQVIAPLTAIGGSIALCGIGVVAFANERAVGSGPAQVV